MPEVNPQLKLWIEGSPNSGVSGQVRAGIGLGPTTGSVFISVCKNISLLFIVQIDISRTETDSCNLQASPVKPPFDLLIPQNSFARALFFNGLAIG